MRSIRLSYLQTALRGIPPPAVQQRVSSAASRSFFTLNKVPAYSKAASNTASRSRSASYSKWRALVSRQLRSVRFNSSSPTPNPTPHLGSPEQALTLSQRFKKLSREYGWSALGVYLLLSALDFPFCFLAVRTLGTERIAYWEHLIVEGFWTLVRVAMPDAGKQQEATAEAVAREGADTWDHGVEAADAKNKSDKACTCLCKFAVQLYTTNTSFQALWTQLALAYAIHKSFIFVRVPLTAAITPKVVKVLRSWGWDIGKRRPKPK